MNITVLSPGPLTTVQDMGRFGAMDTGFSPGGAMDHSSLVLANLLVGNSPEEGVLEMTLMGASLRFSCDTVISLTGADMTPKINGIPVPGYQSLFVKKGDELTTGYAKSGMRGYLAVAGGFDLPRVMGSLSTNLKCKIGGFQGRKLSQGDQIPLKRSSSEAFPVRSLPPLAMPGDVLSLHVIPGPQDDAFTPAGMAHFFTEEYTVSQTSDRMGIRLEGTSVESHNGVDIISDAVTSGSVQIPPSGMPLIMMADRQTTGGYAKIATVISADLDSLAQARPGCHIRFHAVSDEIAVLMKKSQRLQWKRWEEHFPPRLIKED